MSSTQRHIIRGESRPIKFTFSPSPTSEDKADTYRFVLAESESGPDVLSVEFGPGQLIEDEAGDYWTVTLTPTQTRTLTADSYHLAIWASNDQPRVPSLNRIRVGDLPGSSGTG